VCLQGAVNRRNPQNKGVHQTFRPVASFAFEQQTFTLLLLLLCWRYWQESFWRDSFGLFFSVTSWVRGTWYLERGTCQEDKRDLVFKC